jgi:hypothetical protein
MPNIGPVELLVLLILLVAALVFLVRALRR